MTKLVCFDLDDTLIREINSVMYLCMLNGKDDEFWALEALEVQGLHWIESDHRKAILVKGLHEKLLYDAFDRLLKPLANIEESISTLREHAIQSIIITAGPRQVAKAAQLRWGFDYSYGSDFEVKDGVFTGHITRHIGDTGKVGCLKDYCHKHGIDPRDCVSVGDGSTDIPLFEYCGKSIAINAASHVEKKAVQALHTDDLRDILPLILNTWS